MYGRVGPILHFYYITLHRTILFLFQLHGQELGSPCTLYRAGVFGRHRMCFMREFGGNRGNVELGNDEYLTLHVTLQVLGK
jgi:hypothetical protein